MALKGMPAPAADPDTQPFWDGLGKDRLLLPHCAQCQKPRWPPGPMCPYCHSLETAWRDAPASGRLYSWVVVDHPTHPALRDQVPYVIAIVELAVLTPPNRSNFAGSTSSRTFRSPRTCQKLRPFCGGPPSRDTTVSCWPTTS